MPDQRCTVCINSNQTCTYVEDSKKRAPPKGFVSLPQRPLPWPPARLDADLCRPCPPLRSCRYVESLEVRCKKAEDLLVKVRLRSTGLAALRYMRSRND